MADVSTPPLLENKNNIFQIVFCIMGFVLYVLCFVSLYRPYLELIGYGLFFVLHVLMSISIIKSVISTHNINLQINMFETIRKLTRLFINSFSPFYLLYNLGIFIFAAIVSIILLIVYTITIPFQIAINLKLFSGQLPISWTIYIGLLFLFIAFIMLLDTFIKLHAKHTAMNAPVLPVFLQGGSGEVKSGYTFNISGPKGRGYYLNTGAGVNFFFNDPITEKNAANFKIIAITTTVLLWLQYLASFGFDNIGSTIGPEILNKVLILNGTAIISLSSVCIWLTHSIGINMKSIQNPAIKAN